MPAEEKSIKDKVKKGNLPLVKEIDGEIRSDEEVEGQENTKHELVKTEK